MENCLLKIENFKFESHVYMFLCVEPELKIKIVISLTHNYAIKFTTDCEKDFTDFVSIFSELCGFNVLKSGDAKDFNYKSQLIDGNPGHFARRPVVFNLIFTNPDTPEQQKELTLTIDYHKGIVTISI